MRAFRSAMSTEFYSHGHRRRQTRGLVRELPPAEPRLVHRSGHRRSHLLPSLRLQSARRNGRDRLRAGTLGVKGELGSWNWDFASTYGEDEIDMFTRDSANASLYADTGQTPVDFYDGTYTLDAVDHELRSEPASSTSGMAGPMNLAFGAEYREETWEAAPGDEGSRYLEGGQSFPGISTVGCGQTRSRRHGRVRRRGHRAAREAAPRCRRALRGLQRLRRHHRRQADRRATSSPTPSRCAARSSTGFRAPTLAESYYSATNVGPTTAFVQMPPNAPATALLGLGAGLQPGEVDQLLGGLRRASGEKPWR